MNNMSSQQTEQAIKKIGSFGWFQAGVFGVVGYSAIIGTLVVLVMTFSTAEPSWKCRENSTVCTLNGTYKIGEKHYKYRCKIPRSEWKFDVEENFDSIVTEWDLVCDNAVYVSIVNSLTFVLWLVGNVIASILSDKYGRKTMLFPFAELLFICGFASAFASKYWMFAVFRSLVGVGMGGLSVTRYILLMEYIGVKHRGIVGMAFMFNWVLGCLLLALLGYLIPDWRTLSIATSAPGIIFIFFWWCQPESLRWLLMKGKINQAKEILVRAARMNGRHLGATDILLVKEKNLDEKRARLGDVRDLFATRQITKNVLITWYTWLAISMVYYGIILGAPSIGGNMYLNFFISGVCEGIANGVGIFAIEKFGRKKSIAFSIWITGVAIVTSALLMYYDDGSIGYLAAKILVTMAIGRFFVTIAFNGIYVYTSELFPTVIRNTAIGCASGMARIGSGLSPFLLYTQRYNPFIAFAIMAFNALLSGALFCTLPETRTTNMTDTVGAVRDVSDHEETKL